MNSRRKVNGGDSPGGATLSRRGMLAAGGIAVVGGLSGCIGRLASTVTNTTSSPAAAFAGERTEQFRQLTPKVSRLAPKIQGGAGGLRGEVELEGWVTSTAVVAANYNNTRSNRSSIAAPDLDVTDEEWKEIQRYLADEPIIAERFTVSLPDAAVPGGNGSISDAVTPRRLLDYLAGRGQGSGRVYSWGDSDSDGDGLGDCDDTQDPVAPGEVCGRTDHLRAALSAPAETDESLVLFRGNDGSATLLSTPTQGGPTVVWPAGAAATTSAMTWDSAERTELTQPPIIVDAPGDTAEANAAKVTVQPPGCPVPFPAVLYVGRAESDGQIIYWGGWIIDDAALFENSVTMLTLGGPTPVFGIGLADFNGDGLEDLVVAAYERAGRSRGRLRYKARGAAPAAGTPGELTETGVLSADARRAYDAYRENFPTDGGSDREAVCTHLALDAPLLHLTDADGASNEVKFKAGAELSGQVN